MLNRALAETVLGEIWERLLNPALDRAGIDLDRVSRESLRWDAVDITAYWTGDDDAQRHIHMWLVGQWPRFDLRFEGAIWKDEEGQNGEKGQRKYQIYSQSDFDKVSPDFIGIQLSGAADSPEVKIVPSEEIVVGSLMKVVQMVSGARLTGKGNHQRTLTIDLPPLPPRQGSKTPLLQ
jgi:hypothetical protein